MLHRWEFTVVPQDLYWSREEGWTRSVKLHTHYEEDLHKATFLLSQVVWTPISQWKVISSSHLTANLQEVGKINRRARDQNWDFSGKVFFLGRWVEVGFLKISTVVQITHLPGNYWAMLRGCYVEWVSCRNVLDEEHLFMNWATHRCIAWRL